MDYRAALQYLENMGNEYLTMKMGLEKIRSLLRELDDPQQSFRSLLVAGTNGKGSVSRLLASLLQASYPRCGLYMSPHVETMRERIRIAGQPISEALFAHCFSQVAWTIRRCRFKYHPTYFEMLTATAFVAFRSEQVGFAVLEVGLGGRLDATNVVEPEISIITPIGYDHQNILGHTLREIAGEKAGIMRSGKPVVVAPQQDEARQALSAAARRKGALWVELDPSEVAREAIDGGRYRLHYRGCSADLNLYGRYQVDNAALAILAVQTLGGRGISVPARSWGPQLEKVMPHGVLRPLDQDPLTMLDGGHNPQALAALAEFVEEHAPRPRSLVLGMMKDKDLSGAIPPLADLFDQVWFVPLRSTRAASPEDLQRVYPRGRLAESPVEAIRRARAESRFVLIAGSFYLAGEVLQEWEVARQRVVPQPG